jgi:hypothetical protein
VPGQEVTALLAQRRSIRLNGHDVERTPLLVPSFSSKGFPEANKIVHYCEELIDGPTLVSAYDVHYNKISPPFDFASLIFLDSGGYEASKETELSDFGQIEHTPLPWTQEMHEAEIATWKPSAPTVLISYDHPKERVSIGEQIGRARGMAPGRNDVAREILLKPETKTQTLLPVSKIIENVESLAEFDIIGVTEKEIGSSILSRMTNIARLRVELNKVGLSTPIHVFGSLDTLSTPLYFLAGADIFDGLTWLRFAFMDGQTVYKHNFGAMRFGIDTKAHMIDARCWNENYYYMKKLELQMRRYLNGHDCCVFEHNASFLGDSLRSAVEALED